jgi:hypothetical protein
MKSRLSNPVPLPITFVFVTALTLTIASPASAADNVRPPKPVRVQPPPQVDPSTGLPATAPVWIDPNWKDPDKLLKEINYDALPIGVVVEHLRQEFAGAFDVLIPNGWQDPNNPSLSINPQDTTIKMQLRNVSASEVFNAMNMVFEAENTPYRWELKLNGSRPTAMLRVLPQLLHIPDPAPPPQPTTRMVYFVGDLIGNGNPGNMNMEQLVETVSQVYQMSFGESKRVLQFHKDAQLIVVTGTGDQIGFVQQTLSALREKARADYRPPPPKPAEPKPKPDGTKPQ